MDLLNPGNWTFFRFRLKSHLVETFQQLDNLIVVDGAGLQIGGIP